MPKNLQNCYKIVNCVSGKEVCRILLSLWKFIVAFPPLPSEFKEISSGVYERRFPTGCEIPYLSDIKDILRNNITTVAPFYSLFYVPNE